MKTVTNLVSAVGEIVDRLTLPGREKKQLETDILQLLIAVEEKTITEQAAAIREEARGNWLQRSWRPIVMLVFTLIILAGTFLNLPILADTSRFLGPAGNRARRVYHWPRQRATRQHPTQTPPEITLVFILNSKF